MKKSWFITLLLGLSLTAGVVAAVCFPRGVPADECGAAYTAYAGRTGFKTSFIKDYRLGDSLTVDVTMIEAVNDSAWTILEKDFAIPPIVGALVGLINTTKPEFWLAPKEDHSLPMDTVLTDNDCIATIRAERRVWVFEAKRDLVSVQSMLDYLQVKF